jgi:hypothetical protein
MGESDVVRRGGPGFRAAWVFALLYIAFLLVDKPQQRGIWIDVKTTYGN